MFKTQKDVEEAAALLIQESESWGYPVVKCVNRLSKPTKDISLKINLGEIVGEI